MFDENPPATKRPRAVARRSREKCRAMRIMPGMNMKARNTPPTAWVASITPKSGLRAKAMARVLDPRMPIAKTSFGLTRSATIPAGICMTA